MFSFQTSGCHNSGGDGSISSREETGVVYLVICATMLSIRIYVKLLRYDILRSLIGSPHKSPGFLTKFLWPPVSQDLVDLSSDTAIPVAPFHWAHANLGSLRNLLLRAVEEGKFHPRPNLPL